MRGLACAVGAAALLRAPLEAEASRVLVQSLGNFSAEEVPAAAATGWAAFASDAGAKVAMTQSILADHWDVAFNQYIGHKNVMKFVDFWTIFNNMIKITDVRAQKRTASSFVITGELFTSIEALMEIDRVFTKNLGILTDGKKAWDCSQYGNFNRPTLDFTAKGFFPGSTFTSYNMEMEKECLSELKNSMYFVRWGVCGLEKQAHKWTQTMAHDSKNTDFWKDLLQFNSRKSCAGKPLDRNLLSKDMQKEVVARPGIRNTTCVKHSGATNKCSAECARIKECSAVTLNPANDTCCFLEGVVKSMVRSKLVDRYRTKGPSCMEIAGRERFLMMDVDAVSEWLERRGFGKYKQQAKALGGKGISGMVLSFMTEAMLEKWLATQDQAMERARELRCRIDAELNNDPEHDCSDKGPALTQRLWSLFMKYRGKVDNALVAPKGASGRWRSLKWVLDFSRRFAPVEEAVAWSNTLYEIVAVALHAQKVAGLIQDGTESLKPAVMVKAAVSVTGIFKFKESTAFHKCEQVKSYLAPTVRQLHSQALDTSSQQGYVAEQVAKGT